MHSVQFYDTDKTFVDALIRFALLALERGHAVLTIVSAAHAAPLRDALRAAKLDPDELVAKGLFVELDVDEMLRKIVPDGVLDERAFAEGIGRPVTRAIGRCGGVAVFCELLARLWASPDHAAAPRLEHLWRDLRARAPLDLLCAYPADTLAGDEGEHLLENACAVGTEQAVPGDDAAPADHTISRGLVALLRRQTQALERELALRRMLQRRLGQREHELADFLENGAEPMHKLDADGTILWANKAELALLGYADDEYLGRNIADFHVEPQVARAYLRSLAAGEALRDAPAQVRCKDGSIRHLLVNSYALRVDGKLAYVRCCSRDVTAQIRSEQRLRKEFDVWELLRSAGTLDSEADGVRLMQALVESVVELTQAQFGVLLYSDDVALGPQPWLRLCSAPRGDPPAAFPLLLGAEILAPTLQDERTVRCDDVRRHWPTLESDPGIRSYLAVPWKGRSGHFHGGLFLAHPEAAAFSRRDELIVEGIAAQASTALDNARCFQANERDKEEQRMTGEALERRISERSDALERGERQLDQLLAGIADYAIFLLDANGLVKTWNTGAERINGYTAEEIVGRSFALLYTEQERAAGLPDHALDIARVDGKYETEGWRVRKDGSRFWASVLLDAIHDPDSGGIVGFAKVTRDMTERRNFEEQLQQTQRMEAVGRMMGGVAHDFNNLLTIIIGNLDAICREQELRPKVRAAAEHALRGAQHATSLTRQLLAFSRRQTLNPRPTDINRLAAGTAGLLKRTFGESIAILTELSEDLGACEVDAPQLESALINLAMNARDAMPAGGRLTISTRNARVDDPGRSPPRARDYVTVAISDTGSGMSAEVREHAFEPFFTTKPASRGTGLGLSQVYGFARQSGGLVKLQSEPGRGTTVTIFLPRMNVEVPDPAEATPLEEPVGHGTILLVEDNEEVRRYSSGLLRELGFDVVEAADGETALDRLEQHPEVRLLFTDVGLPGIDGAELAEHARRRMPGLKVLFTTGYAHHSLELSIRKNEGGRLLRKPYTRPQLARCIREMLEAGDRRASRLRALLVEDNAPLRNLTARMLEEMQFEIGEAESASAALDLIGGGERFDFALIDRQLPDGDGLAVAAAVRAAHPATPVVLTSGLGEPELLQDAGLIAGTLQKPYGYEELMTTLARLGVQPEPVRRDRP